MTYGQFACGTSTAILLQQRRAVAQATAPAAGTAGQNLNLALMSADGSAKGKADPAFDAHLDPLVHWALAVWYEWVPRPMLNRIIAYANVKQANAVKVLAAVMGPAAAVVATAGRLNWTVQDELTFRTDQGKVLKLHLDPPAVVAR